MFGHAADDRPNTKTGTSGASRIQKPVQQFQDISVKLRDWSPDPDLLLDVQDLYHAATVEAWPHGGPVPSWADPYATPTLDRPCNCVQSVKSE